MKTLIGALKLLLGVRRPGVTRALALKKAGAVSTSRGHIRVLDRAILELIATTARAFP